MADNSGVPKAGVGLSTAHGAAGAGAEAAERALSAAGAADAALLFAGPGYGDELPLMLDAVATTLGTEAIVGASAHGILANGSECENQPAVGVLALAGLDAKPFLLVDTAGAEQAACREIAARLGRPPGPEDLVVLLPDPGNFNPEVFLPQIAEVFGPARVVGAGAGDPTGGTPVQWCGRTVASGAVAGMLIRGTRPARVGVTQACRPVTDLLTVTRARGHWILEIDGRPALEVYRELARGRLAEDLRRAAAFVLAALPVAGEDLAPGSYLVRHVIGFEENENAFAIPVELRAGDRLAFAFRDAEAAREDLKAMLDPLAGTGAAAALYFDCCARGEAFFGVPGLESAYLERALGPVPMLGMFGSCEIGPVGATTELLTYTGVLALLEG
ncbi:MAG: FIST N-terminal domain-containing protein [Myxococcota bacterium]|nr:FIST N-terminal domain-containing protein [Myxococcota bacterium]HJO23609.1 FIST N-terminal domain-containing protein [Myxococcota bacterium]